MVAHGDSAGTWNCPELSPGSVPGCGFCTRYDKHGLFTVRGAFAPYHHTRELHKREEESSVQGPFKASGFSHDGPRRTPYLSGLQGPGS